MTFDPTTVPRPKSEADYAACYTANLIESRDAFERALARYRQFRKAGQITPRADDKGGWVCEGPEAMRVLGDVIRHRSDLDHWHTRKTTAERAMRGEAVREDSRLPAEVERAAPADDVDDPDAW
jgi:hypothetical protein